MRTRKYKRMRKNERSKKKSEEEKNIKPVDKIKERDIRGCRKDKTAQEI